MFKYSAKLQKGYADLKYGTLKKKKVKSTIFMCLLWHLSPFKNS